MTMLTIFGMSDDYAGLAGLVRDEFYSHDGRFLVQVGNRSGGVLVEMVYAERGAPGWSAYIHLLEGVDGREGAPIPWPITVKNAQEANCDGKDYSVAVEIACPEGTPIKYGRMFAPPSCPECDAEIPREVIARIVADGGAS